MSVDIKDFGDTDKKLISKLSKRGAFDAVLETPVNMGRVNIEVMSRWVGERLTDVLGFEDEVVIGLVTNLLSQRTDPLSGQLKKLDPKALQVQLTGFLEKKAPAFVTELWTLLVDAQDAPYGIPRAFVERKKRELVAQQVPVEPEAAGDRESAQRRLVLAAGGELPDASTTKNRRRDDDDDDGPRRRRRRFEDVGRDDHRRRSRDDRRFFEDDRRPSDGRRDQERSGERRRGFDRSDEKSEERSGETNKRPALPIGWEWRESRSQAGSWYCFNVETGERRWEAPSEKAVVRHVLVKHTESKRPSSWREERIELSKAAARDQLLAIRRQIEASSDPAAQLATIAEQRSDCPSASKGGNLKPFSKGELDKAFEAAAFALAPGTLSPIVETPSGIHLIFRLA
ncbi:hypothetical protein CTAYLR_004202 [Chrysophaeum taylorii]|uniref:peptidylprolyl isomerase n=1 Tax=Chrysophaeum taylorii TaxID=2483200 RepID=A0AAD7UDL8_9STRA|nr:hypothetical protein CTAYLR_004202 [Chrysophaeum taylorii]